MRVCGVCFCFVLSLDSFPLEKEEWHMCFVMFDTSAKVAWMMRWLGQLGLALQLTRDVVLYILYIGDGIFKMTFHL